MGKNYISAISVAQVAALAAHRLNGLWNLRLSTAMLIRNRAVFMFPYLLRGILVLLIYRWLG
jgi:hypothetical protein